MADTLKPADSSMGRQTLVVGGMGGIGKTQLTIAYAKTYHQKYDSVFWLNATTCKTLEVSLEKLTHYALPPDELENCDGIHLRILASKWLSCVDNHHWLLIFDDYDEPDQYDISRYYPSASHGSIIITTRRPDEVCGKVSKVSHMHDIVEGLEILQSRSERQNVASDLAARQLAQRLRGLPLALATVGAYLKNNTISFHRHLEEYEKKWNVSPRRPTKLPEYEARTLYITWNLSFTRLQQHDYEASQLLTLLAYFDSQDIWYDLFYAGRDVAIHPWLSKIAGDDMEFGSTMGRLIEYCFAEARDETSSYSAHTCVHDWIFHSLNPMINPDSYRYAVGCVAASIANEDREILSSSKCRRLAAHGVRLSHSRFLEMGQVLDGTTLIARMLTEQGFYNEAERMTQYAIRSREETLGSDHELTLNTIHSLAILYKRQGELEKADEMYQRVLKGYEGKHGRDHVQTLRAFNNIANLYHDQGKLDEAEEMYQKALQGEEKVLGLDERLTHKTANHLGNLYYRQGRLEEAERMYQRVLQGKENKNGIDPVFEMDQLNLNAANNLASLYSDQGKLKGAELMYQKVFRGYEKTLGPDHRSTLDTLYNLGLLYEDQKRMKSAEEMYRQAFHGYQKTHGSEHSKTKHAKEEYDRVRALLAVPSWKA